MLRYVPLIVQHVAPALYQKAKNYILDMTYSDNFYIISYPTYSGFKIKHDPTYTAYIAETTDATQASKWFGLILLGGIIVLIAVGAILVLKRRGTKTQALPPPIPQTTAS